MYQYFYSSSDVQIYLTSLDHTKIVKVDTAISVGYNVRQTSVPIFSLGSRKTQYHTGGNTLCSGVLAIAFTDEEYLKYCLDEVATPYAIGSYSTTDPTASNNNFETGGTLAPIIVTAAKELENGTYKSTRLGIKNMSNTSFIGKANQSSQVVTGTKRIISIGAIQGAFNIKIYLNNETAIRGSDSKVICLENVKIVNERLDTDSTRDAPIMVVYDFNFEDISRG